MTALTNIEDFLSSEATDAEKAIAAFFHKSGADAISDATAFVKALVASIATNGGKVLEDAATAEVAAAEAAFTDPASGIQKLAMAQAGIAAKLVAEGIPVVKAAVNSAIEAAVAQQKANDAATAAPVTVTQPTTSAQPGDSAA